MLKCAFSTCNSRKANTNYIVPREAYKDRPDPQARWSQHGPSATPRCKELWFPHINTINKQKAQPPGACSTGAVIDVSSFRVYEFDTGWVTWST